MKIPPELQVSEIIARLTAAEVDFVVVGGIAVVLLGSARNTKDVDITYDTAHENLVKLGHVLIGLNARLRGVDEDIPFVPDERTLGQVSLLALDTDAGWLDLLAQPPGGPPYAELRARSTAIELGGVSVRVADIDDLIAMKKIAGRPQDVVDVGELEAIKRLRAEQPGG